MNRKQKFIVSIILLCFCGTLAMAQNLGGDSIYKPDFKTQLIKPPQQNRAAVLMRPAEEPALEYSNTMLKPLGFSQQKIGGANYATIGIGNLSSINAEGLYKWEHKKRLYYLGGSYDAADAGRNQKFRDIDMVAGTKIDYNKHKVDLIANYANAQRYRYGSSTITDAVPFNSFGFRVQVNPNTATQRWSGGLAYSNNTVSYGFESLLQSNLFYRKNIGQKLQEGFLKANINPIVINDSNHANNLIELGANQSKASEHNFTNLGLSVLGTNKGFSLLPNFIFIKKNKNNNVLRTHYIGRYQVNSLADIYRVNPFQQPLQTFTPTIVRELLVQYDFVVKKNMDISIGAGYDHYKNMLVYRSVEIDNSRNTQLQGLYQARQSAPKIKCNAEYHTDIDLVVKLGIEKLFWSANTPAWHLPSTIYHAEGKKTFGKRTSLSAYFDAWGKRTSGIDQTLQLRSIDPMLNLNIRADYQYSDQWVFFVKGNNLLNASYQIWNNYEVLPLQAMIGVHFKPKQR